jgi:GTP pyrophosphokinase
MSAEIKTFIAASLSLLPSAIMALHPHHSSIIEGARMTGITAVTTLTARFTEALTYAATLHATQRRKGSNEPYTAHLLGVTALVLEDSGDEDEAIAALLHDAVEDQGGQETLTTIRARFGERVARIVEGCTDADVLPKPPWQERKERYIAHLRHAPADVRRVSLADKLHNARAILRDLRACGGALWDRFNGGKAGTLWYYRTLAIVFQETKSGPNADELARVVVEIELLS